MSWALGGTEDDTAPLSVISWRRKNDIALAFFDIDLLGSDGETNSLFGVNPGERAARLRCLTARTGQRTRSGRSPTKSSRDCPMTDLWEPCRQRGCKQVYDRRPPVEKILDHLLV